MWLLKMAQLWLVLCIFQVVYLFYIIHIHNETLTMLFQTVFFPLSYLLTSLISWFLYELEIIVQWKGLINPVLFYNMVTFS